MRAKHLIFFVFTALLVAALLFVIDRAEWLDVPNPFQKEYEKQSVELPRAEPYQPPAPVVSPPPAQEEAPSEAAPLPSEVNLAIPFTVQAPFANWDRDHEDFCEEASVLMAASFVLGKEIPSPEFADARMYELKEFQLARFGYFESTTAEETAMILRDHYGISAVAVVENPSEETIRRAVASGKAVIVPAAGRELGNPYFRQPGPLYHMLVVKGYAKDGRFITNDPGTKRGADYLYDPTVLLNAIHDWNGGAVETGRRAVIIVG
ncbi:MAG: C39 family peptidase [Candidatus Terrybacteria bacterium]|nr:C39 family peptidase [Candidatus Terrybacteria bacterium]